MTGKRNSVKKKRDRQERFSLILLRYFLLLFLCLVFPVVGVSSWYGRQIRNNVRTELIRQNETSLQQVYNTVDAVLRSVKNTAYSISVNENVQYVATINAMGSDSASSLRSVMNMLSITQSSAEYIDSAYIYLDATAEIITKTGATTNPQLFEDAEILRTYQKDLPLRTLTIPRIQENRYPYLLTFLHSIRLNLSRTNVGMVVLNVDAEKLGDYIDRGRYRNTEDAPMLLIFDKDMQTMVYSDEYRLLRGENDMQELQTLVLAQGDTFTTTGDLWGKGYVISGMISSDDNLRYLYLSTTQAFDNQNRAADQRLLLSVAVICLICLMLASLLAAWVYRPIRKTVRLLSDMSMLTEWDRKEHMDEIEAIQRSIVQAKKQRDDMDEEIQERMVSLHNAQICALQTQINPHFLFNTLESIGNASALLMGGENQVTDMIYTLSKMMRLSLSNENYLVPLSEELEHVRQYVALIDFRFRGRVTLHLEIPDEMTSTRIVKLTLQPLIENAIQHGLAHVRSGGEIWIRGEKIDEAYYLYVSDNGKGVDDAELELLTKQLKDSAITGNGHIGIRNVDQRMKLVFGEEYGLALSKAPEGGLRVTLHYKTI